MAHKILMLGGRRAGKSSILACILQALNDTPGNICTFSDQTVYNNTRDSESSNYTLVDKRREISQYIQKIDARPNNAKFLVDMTPSDTRSVYTLRATISGNTFVDFDFVDVPGEWMNPTVSEHSTLITDIESTDVYIIAVDTPYLMEADSDVNDVYNRITEISNAMGHLKIGNEYDKKLIIFCPIKCEKWVEGGLIDQVTSKIETSYKQLINTWAGESAVEMWCMPILTAGGLEFSKLLPGKLLFRDPTVRGIGERCSISLTGQIMLKGGEIMSNNPKFKLQDDDSLTISFVDIPLSWYQSNRKGFSPERCEQPAYHLLRFLVNKESRIMEAERQGGFFGSIINFFRSLIFGDKLPLFKAVITQIEGANLIKDSGDGFKRITDITL